MHIAEGVLSLPVLLIGASGAAAGVAVGLKKINIETIPRAGIVSAALFVSSLIHVNIGPTSAHLILNGIGGLLLGLGLFPSYLVALFLQALLFQFGGLVVLGVNTCTMALSGILGGLLGRYLLRLGKPVWLAGALAGATGVAGAGIFTALALAGSGEAFFMTAKLILLAHIPVIGIESLVGAFIMTYISRVMPSLLEEWKK
ncbi:MAG: cobalt transporter CbiM [Aminobacterium sp.]|jgi:cobalt/nickel transport system permease protein|uniref:cobalt transporter CbiM n=1 Tax=unclassified Aminobacterium TaxID=2685012 RepID=UPI001BD155FF|nr:MULTISPECIES: cobalt transporter CbiM [unclassified Aminobacterium]MDD2206351.1 cobalt transporter CbiM [Aminobacterium sp.]MDD3425837.1 cobalt transporter CbiM [Aminobacterium sp.]MDD3707502.1 cobalt transporter CbiM [Aminobacterium sp.]MDD4228368.1 cobalt transporter CbiM [Aminobacterium sp.]MDD4552264.1 cobalt transporter CbiM [Aminobacterium sp.]